MSIDYRPDVPRNIQIADVLRARIRDGTYPPRTPLPSEPALVTEFGVNRGTIRKALQKLRQDGYARTVSGMGSFVTDSAEWPSDAQS